MIDAARGIRRQHCAAIERVIAEHVLWAPRLVRFTTRLGDDIVELSDGRAFLVRTAPRSNGDGLVFETTVTSI